MATEDEAAVRAVINAFIDAWNRHDMKMLSALFSEDADFVDVFGNWFEERTAIEKALTQRHATVFQNSPSLRNVSRSASIGPTWRSPTPLSS